jgi:hypothetical protein
MQTLKNVADTVLSTTQISELLRISPQYLAALEKAGTIKRLAKNQWPLSATVQNYLQSVQSRRHHNSDALRRVRELQAERLRVANAMQVRELIPAEEAELVIDIMCGFVRAELNALPLRATRDLHVQRRLQEEIDACLNRIAGKMREQAGALRNGEFK